MSDLRPSTFGFRPSTLDSRLSSLTRRDVLAGLLGLPVALAAGCGRDELPPAGEIVGASHTAGHRIRDGFRPRPADDAWEKTGVVIVGGGIAGLSAARRLRQSGFDDFVLLELEAKPGGTSQSGKTRVVAHPWGAHYLPAPMQENKPLVDLLDEMGVLEGRDAEGEPIVAEQFLCRDPEQRIFFEGRWREELYPHHGETARDKSELAKFRRKLDAWVRWRDAQGRRAFGLPIATASDDAYVTQLDRISMKTWMKRQGFQSRRLYWMVDFSCRDDYGLTLEQTSAWAGLFYFASRIRKPQAKPQPLISWPEGNGRFVAHMVRQVRKNIRLGMAVTEIVTKQDAGKSALDVVAVNSDGKTARGWHAERVIFAAPHFLAPYLIRGFADDAKRAAAASKFEYGSWMVANLVLRDRPAENGFALSWENVIYDSPSLGYIVATHQKGLDFGPTVLTYYYPLTDEDPNAGRRRLLDLGWKEWAEIVLTDLETAHPDIRPLVERLDVMRWGHAMIRPRPGFVWGPERAAAGRPFRGVHFANTDLSGVALFEEAFYHGNRAADEVLQTRSLAAKS